MADPFTLEDIDRNTELGLFLERNGDEYRKAYEILEEEEKEITPESLKETITYLNPRKQELLTEGGEPLTFENLTDKAEEYINLRQKQTKPPLSKDDLKEVNDAWMGITSVAQKYEKLPADLVDNKDVLGALNNYFETVERVSEKKATERLKDLVDYTDAELDSIKDKHVSKIRDTLFLDTSKNISNPKIDLPDDFNKKRLAEGWTETQVDEMTVETLKRLTQSYSVFKKEDNRGFLAPLIPVLATTSELLAVPLARPITDDPSFKIKKDVEDKINKRAYEIETDSGLPYRFAIDKARKEFLMEAKEKSGATQALLDIAGEQLFQMKVDPLELGLALNKIETQEGVQKATQVLEQVRGQRKDLNVQFDLRQMNLENVFLHLAIDSVDLKLIDKEIERVRADTVSEPEKAFLRSVDSLGIHDYESLIAESEKLRDQGLERLKQDYLFKATVDYPSIWSEGISENSLALFDTYFDFNPLSDLLKGRPVGIDAGRKIDSKMFGNQIFLKSFDFRKLEGNIEDYWSSLEVPPDSQSPILTKSPILLIIEKLEQSFTPINEQEEVNKYIRDSVNKVYNFSLDLKISDPDYVAAIYTTSQTRDKLDSLYKEKSEAKKEGNTQKIEELDKNIKKYERTLKPEEEILKMASDEGSYSSSIHTVFGGFFNAIASYNDVGDSYTKAKKEIEEMQDQVLSELIEEQKSPTGDLFLRKLGRQVEDSVLKEEFDYGAEYKIDDPIVQRIARSRLYNQQYDYRGEAKYSVDLKSDILTAYLGTELELGEILKRVQLGSDTVGKVESINANESIAEGQHFGRLIANDTSNRDDLLTYSSIREMKKKDIPSTYRVFFNGQDEDSIEKMIKDGTFSRADFDRLFRDATFNSNALDVQPLTEIFGQALQYATFETVVDSQSFEITKSPLPSFYVAAIAPSVAEEVIAEIPVDLQDLIPDFLDKYQSSAYSYADWYGGGKQDVAEYRRLRVQSLNRKSRTGIDPLAQILFNDDQLFNDLQKYVDGQSKEENGDGAMSYDDLHKYTMTFLNQVADDPDEPRLNRAMLSRLDDLGYLEDIGSIYGKALAQAMTGELDFIPFTIGTPAGMDFYLQDRSDNFVGIRPAHSKTFSGYVTSYLLNLGDSLAHDPKGFQEGFGALGSGLGFNDGSVHQRHMNTGNYLSVVVPFERIVGGAIGTSFNTARKSYAGVKEGGILGVFEGATEVSPTVTQVARGIYLEHFMDTPEGSRRGLSDGQLLADVIEEQTFQGERLKSNLGTLIGGTTVVGAVGYFIGGAEGAILASIFNNSPAKQFGYDALFKAAGLADMALERVAPGLADSTNRGRGFSSLPYYKRTGEFHNYHNKVTMAGQIKSIQDGQNPIQETMQGVTKVSSKAKKDLDLMKESFIKAENDSQRRLSREPTDKEIAKQLNMNEQQYRRIKEQIIEYESQKPAKNYYEKDLLETYIRQIGFDPKEIMIVFHDLISNNLKDKSRIVAKILSGQKLGKYDRLMKRLDPDKQLQILSGRESAIQQTDGYRRVSGELDGLVKSNVMSEADKTLTLGFHFLLAMNDIKHFDDISFSSEDLRSPINVLIDTVEDIGKKRTPQDMNKLIKDNIKDFKDLAYLKSTGLFQYIEAQKELTIGDMRRYIDRFELITIIDPAMAKTVDFVDNTKFRKPSKEMDDYLSAKVIIDGQNVWVFYKVQKNTLEIAEIHLQSPDIMELDNNVNLRVLAVEKLFQNKLKTDSITKLQWNKESAFYQIIDAKEKQMDLFNSKIYTYMQSFLVKPKPPSVTETSVSIGALVIGSFRDYFDVRLSKKINLKSPVEDFALPVSPLMVVADLDAKGLKSKVFTKSKELKDTVEKKNEIKEYNSTNIEKVFAEVKYKKDLQPLHDAMSNYYLLFGKWKEELKSYKERIDKATDSEAEFNTIKQEIIDDVDFQIVKKRVKLENTKKKKERELQEALNLLNGTAPKTVQKLLLYLEDGSGKLSKGLKDSADQMNKVDFKPTISENIQPKAVGRTLVSRGTSRNIRIAERQTAKIKFKKLASFERPIVIIDQILSKSSDELNMKIAKEEMLLAEASNNKDKKTHQKNLKEYKKQTQSLGDNIDDLFSDERQILRDLITSEERVIDYIGYAEDDILYGSAIRQEFKYAGLDIKEHTTEFEGVTYHFIELTNHARNVLKRKSLAVIDTQAPQRFIGMELKLLNDSIDEGLEVNQKYSDDMKKWLGIDLDEDNNLVIKKAIKEQTDSTHSIVENKYFGYSRDEARNLSAKDLPANVKKELKSYASRKTDTFVLVDVDGRKYKAQIQAKTLDGVNVLEVKGSITEKQAKNLLYMAAQQGLDKVYFRNAKASIKNLQNSIGWDLNAEQRGQLTIFTISDDMKNSVADQDQPLFRKAPETKIDNVDVSGERLQINVSATTSKKSFFEANAHLLGHVLDPKDWEELVLTLNPNPTRSADGKIFLSKADKKEIAFVLDSISSRSNSIPDQKILHFGQMATQAFARVGLYGLKVLQGDARDTKFSIQLKKFFRDFDITQEVDAEATRINMDNSSRRYKDASEKLINSLFRDVQGLIEAAKKEGMKPGKSVRNALQVKVPTSKLEAAIQKKEQKAQISQREKYKSEELPNDALIYNVTPSKYNSHRNKNALQPERKRAKQNRLEQQLKRKATEQEIESFELQSDLTGEEIDTAFRQLYHEGKAVDVFDLVLRLNALVKLKTTLYRSGGEAFIAITDRTLLREQDVETYRIQSNLKLLKILGVNHTDELAIMFNSGMRTIPMSIQELLRRKDQPRIMFPNEVKLRLRSHLNDVRGTPGMHNLSEDLRKRIQDTEVDGIEIYLQDTFELKDSIIDVSVPTASRRNKKLESGNRHIAYNIVTSLKDIKGVNLKVLTKSIEKVVDRVFEQTSPRFLDLEVDDLSIRVKGLVERYFQEMRSIKPDLKRVLSLLLIGQEDVRIKDALLKLGLSNTNAFLNPNNMRLAPAMLDIMRLMRRSFDTPVDPVHIPFMVKTLNTLGVAPLPEKIKLSGDDLIQISDLKTKKLQLDKAGLQRHKAPYEVILKYLESDKDVKQGESNKVQKSTTEFDQIYLDETRSALLTLKDLKTETLDTIETIFTVDKTQDELNAFFNLRSLLLEKDSDLSLQEQLQYSAEIDVIIEGLKRRLAKVEIAGQNLLASLNDKNNDNNPMTAYTLFHQGRVVSFDTDIKSIRESTPFKADKPPNLTRWVAGDIANVARQYGMKGGDSVVFGQLEQIFGVDARKLNNNEDFSALANQIMYHPPNRTEFSSLLDLVERSDPQVPLQKVKRDNYAVLLEMMVRLVATEKMANLSRQISEVHMYGDLQKITRERLVEIGLNPIDRKEDFIGYVQEFVENWMKNGWIEVFYGNTLYKPKDTPIRESAKEVASEIIRTYGIQPSVASTDGQVVRHISPSGQELLIPNQLDKIFVDIMDNLAATGVATRRRAQNFANIKERKYNASRLAQSLNLGEKIKEKLIEVLQKEKQLSREQANSYVSKYLRELNPEFIETKKLIGKNADETIDLLGKSFSEEVKGFLRVIYEDEGKDLYERSYDRHWGTLYERPRLYKGMYDNRSLPEDVKILLDAENAVREAFLASDEIGRRAKKDTQKELTKSWEDVVQESSLEPDTTTKRKDVAPEKQKADVLLVDEKFLINRNELLGAVSEATAVISATIAEGASSYVSKVMGSKGKVKTTYNTLQPFLLEPLNLLLKRAVTAGVIMLNTAYYVTNMFGALFQTYTEEGLTGMSKLGAGIGRNPKLYGDTIRILHKDFGGLAPGARTSGTLVTRDGRIYTAESLAQACDQHGIGSSFVRSELGREALQDMRKADPNNKGLLSIISAPISALNDFYLELANTTDNLFRVALFIELINDGLSEADAAKRVRNTYYDYTDLSKTERDGLRKVFLFYSYARKNQVQIFRALASNPSRVMAQLRLIRNSQERYLEEDIDPGLLQDYMQMRLFGSGIDILWKTKREQYTFEDEFSNQITFHPNIGAVDVNQYLSILTPIFVDNVEWLDWFSEFSKWGLSQTSISIKMAYEFVADKLLFGGRSLDKLRIRKDTVDAINALGFHLFGTTADYPDGHIRLTRVNYDTQNNEYLNEPYYIPEDSTQVLKLYATLQILNLTPGLSLLEGRGSKQARFLKTVAENEISEFYYNLMTGTNLGKEIEMNVGMNFSYGWSDMLGERHKNIKSLDRLRTQGLKEIQKQESN